MADGKKIVYGFKNGILALLKNNNSGDQRPDILGTLEQSKFDDFLEQIRGKQKNINIKLFDKYFPYGRPDEMVQDLFDSKNKVDNCDKLVLIHRSFDYIAKRTEKMPPSTNKNGFVKILNIVKRDS